MSDSSVNSLVASDFGTQWVAERDGLIALAKSVETVDSDESLQVAGDVQTRMSKAIKRLETERKNITSPIDDLKKKIMAEEKKLATPLSNELARIKNLTAAYATECARRIEEETRRREIEEARLAEAAAAAAESDPFGFDSVASVVPTRVPVADMPKTTANRMVAKWDFKITNEHLVPRELCSVDERKIRALLAQKKAEGYKAEQIVIPGIAITSSVQVYAR